jgi:hypothetical protein
VLLGADYVTSSPRVCRSCHEMAPRGDAWAESAHAEVVCVSCHEAPTAWYALPQRLVARVGLLGRDTWWHFSGGSDDSGDESGSPHEDARGSALVSSENCLQCHDPNRQATSGLRILIDHAEHAEMNGTCLSCHINTGHPEETRGRALSLMDQCFNCHGTGDEPDAAAECDVCHPSDYELVPATHKAEQWDLGHSELATTDPGQCELCHEAAFCTDCHGLEMPHPEGWAKGATGHAVFAEADREVCTRCHREKPDFCSMCHHEAFDPAKGTWVKQHFLEVRNRGTAFCFECHLALFCADCHASQPSL